MNMRPAVPRTRGGSVRRALTAIATTGVMLASGTPARCWANWAPAPPAAVGGAGDSAGTPGRAAAAPPVNLNVDPRWGLAQEAEGGAAPPPPAPAPVAPPPAPRLLSPDPGLQPPPPWAPPAPPTPWSSSPGAPLPPPPPAPYAPATPPRARIAVAPRFAYRLGDAGRTISPAAGFGVGGTVEVAYLRGQTRGDPQAESPWEAAVGLDFGFDWFATSETGTVIVEGIARTFGATRVVSETSFVLVHTVAARWRQVRPFLTVGGGMGLGYFDSVTTALLPGTASDTHLLGRGLVGVDVALAPLWGVTVRADYTAVRSASPFRTADGRTLALFGDLFDLGVGFAYRF